MADINTTLGKDDMIYYVKGNAGVNTTYTDNGGNDTYSIKNLNGNVVIDDADDTVIILRAGLDVTAAKFSTLGVELTIDGHTLQLIGEPSRFTFKFAGDPEDPAAGVAKTLAETAAAFGVTTLTAATQPATTVGVIGTNGTIGGGVTPTGYTLTADKASVEEGSSVEFTLTVGTAPTADTVFTYNITGDTISGSVDPITASGGDMDVTPVSNQITIKAGETSVKFTVNANTDNKSENLEGMKVSILDGNNAVVTNKVVTVADKASDNTIIYLTYDPDTKEGVTFEAPQVYTPGGDDFINSLQNDDKLTGKAGTDTVLNATLGNPNDNGAVEIMPELTNIKTINAKFDATSANMILDLQDSTGVENVNISRVATGRDATVRNIADTQATNLSVNNANSPAGTVSFTYLPSAVEGGSDEVDLTVNNVVVNNLVVQSQDALEGFETVNLESTGKSNTVRQLIIEDSKLLNITGDQKLTLGNQANTVDNANRVEAIRYVAGLGNVSGSLEKADASGLDADISINLGAEVVATKDNTSGVAVNFNYVGSAKNDLISLVNGMNAGDIIDGGQGTNTLNIFANTTNGSGKNIQALNILTGHDDAGIALGLGVAEAADTVTLDANAFDDLLTSVYIRNEGMGSAGFGVAATGTWVSKAEGMTITLNNLNATQATNLSVAHGTTGNSTIANNIVNIAFETAAANNATQLTLVDATNNDPVFNLQFNAANAELVTIVDNDTESNSVHLPDAARTQAGSTLTVLPGTASDTGKFMNFDTTPNGTGTVLVAQVVDVAGNDYPPVLRRGYGTATDGTVFNNTVHLDRESAALVTAGGFAVRDAAASSVFYGTAGVAADGVTRHTFENLAAGSYEGDVIIRVADITRADGVTSMKLTTGAGNDTFIFDALGLTSAGFTSGDTITASTGTDTLVLDGNTATIPGTPRIDHQTSEWDNLKGIDVLRFANNGGVANVGNAARVANAAGAYYARLDNEFIAQTDAGNRLTVINNDGDLANNTESDLVLDMRGLSQDKWVTFIGANSNAAVGLSSNRLVVDNNSANQNMILNGGDTDVRNLATANWVGYTAGNNNVYEVRNTANVSVSDLSQTSNFGLIEFTNDAATPQTLTLTLNNTIIEQMVDSSRTSTTAATQEVLLVTAIDNGGIASILNVDAREVSGFHALNVTGSAAGNDVLYLNNNIGGTQHTVNLGASLGDRVNWVGGAAGTVVTVELGTNVGVTVGAGNGWAQFVLGAVTTVHDVDAVEIVDLTGLTYATSTLTGAAANETFVGGAGNDAIGLAVGGVDTVVFASTAALNGVDAITGFTAGAGAGGDILNFESFLTTAGTTVTVAVGVLDGVEIASAANVVANNTIVGYDGGGGMTTAGIAALFQTTAAPAANVFNMADNGRCVIIEGDDDAALTAVSIYYVNAALDGTGTNVTAADVTLIGTINATDIDTFVAANFTVA